MESSQTYSQNDILVTEREGTPPRSEEVAEPDVPERPAEAEALPRPPSKTLSAVSGASAGPSSKEAPEEPDTKFARPPSKLDTKAPSTPGSQLGPAPSTPDDSDWRKKELLPNNA